MSTKKKILIGYLLAVSLATSFVPFAMKVRHKVHADFDYGYHFIYPDDKDEEPSIDYGRIFLNIIWISSIAGVFCCLSDTIDKIDFKNVVSKIPRRKKYRKVERML